MSVREDILRLLEERGGEFRAPAGNAGRLIAEAIGVEYNLTSTTLYRMVKRGELEKITDHPRRAFAYRLLPAPGHVHGAIATAEAAAPHILRHEGLGTPAPDELASTLLRALEQHTQHSAELRRKVEDARRALREADDRLAAVAQALADPGEAGSINASDETK